jgi:mRNA interferase MazF
MKEGDVIVVRMAQADGTTKNRPTILLRELPKHGDWLVCGISTQLHQHVAGFDERLDTTDSDYAASGLVQPSVIRLGFLAVVPRNRVPGSIGFISPDRHTRLLRNLANHLVSAIARP